MTFCGWLPRLVSRSPTFATSGVVGRAVVIRVVARVVVIRAVVMRVVVMRVVVMRAVGTLQPAGSGARPPW